MELLLPVLNAGKMKISKIERDAATDVADLRVCNYVNINWQVRRGWRWNIGESCNSFSTVGHSLPNVAHPGAEHRDDDAPDTDTPDGQF